MHSAFRVDESKSDFLVDNNYFSSNFT